MRTIGVVETVSAETDEPPSLKTVSPSSTPKKTNNDKASRLIPRGPSASVVGIAEARRESFPTGKVARQFHKKYFPGVTAQDWNDWRWQLRSRIKSLAELERMFTISADERDAILRHKGALPVGITPYYASLLDRDNPDDGLRRTHIPVGQ
jgi:lysine 2,3-aminomutase